MKLKEEGERVVRGDMNVADLTAMGFVGLDVDATMRVPKANSTVLAAAQAIIAVGVESSG